MEIRKVKKGDRLELALQGRLDAYWSGHLETELDEIIRDGNHQLYFDLTGVSFISSAGIRVFLKFFQMLKGLGGSLAVNRLSAAVQSVFELTGLMAMVELEPREVEPEAALSKGEGRAYQFGNLLCQVYGTERETLSCHLVGDPASLTGAGYSADSSSRIALPPGCFALGVGALGVDFADCRDRFGEFLAAGGAAAYLPAGDAKIPDYMLAAGSLVPQMQVLYAIRCQGEMPRCVRFEVQGPETSLPLSKLVEAGFELSGSESIGMVMIAESAGLIGAALRRSPGAGPTSLGYPEVRNWLSFTPERSYERCLTVVTGVAAKQQDPQLAPFVRPVDASGTLLGHFHGAAFSFRALPKGEISLDETAAKVFGEQSLLGILHLINDHRDISGAGESLFVRGAFWVAPIKSARV